MLPPNNVTGHGYNSTSINVIWEDIPFEGRNGIIQGFYVSYAKIFEHNNSLGYEMHVRLKNMTAKNGVYQFVVEGLIRDSEYNFTVSGYTQAGVGVKSDMVKIPTGDYRK